MTLRDIWFWIRSAQADSNLSRLRKEGSTEQAFDRLYAETTDPWGVSLPQYRYQRLKYQIVLSLLPPGRRYAKALDIGCGLGCMTRMLAPYCEQVVGVDVSSSAIDQARALSKDVANVEYRRADVRGIDQRFGREFDLIVVADTLYYLSPLSDEALKSVRQSIENLLVPGGLLLLVNHFFFDFDSDSRLSRQIHDAFRWGTDLKIASQHKRPFYLVSVLEKASLEQSQN